MILDFGKVLCHPTTGYWLLPPIFFKLVDISKIDIDLFKEKYIEYHYITQRKVVNLEEEYQMFYEFYDNIFSNINYNDYKKEISHNIAYNLTYESDKYIFYENILDELKKLKEEYVLLLLSDNWPCAIRIMEEKGIYDYFDKIYISSIYGCEKSDRVFFDYPINDYNIKLGEAIFIDDNEKLLDIAHDKGLDVRLMDRDNKIVKSKYKVIHDLYNI